MDCDITEVNGFDLPVSPGPIFLSNLKSEGKKGLGMT